MQTILTCSGIQKSFARLVVPTDHLQDRILRPFTRRERWRMDALQSVDLTVHSNEWVGLYGPNGSGKTTLLRILAGLMSQDAGSVELQGKLSCFLGLGTGFHPERTARENILFHALLHGIPARQAKELTQQIISFAGTGTHKDLPLKCYSTGMQLRLAFAAAVFTDADLYMFDELLAVGDKEFQEKCEKQLQLLKKSGKSALIVSHDLKQLERLCDRIYHMQAGVLQERVLAAVS